MEREKEAFERHVRNRGLPNRPVTVSLRGDGTILASREITVTDGEGKQETFGPGDSFFIAQGEDSTWEIHETMRKSFFLHIAAG